MKAEILDRLRKILYIRDELDPVLDEFCDGRNERLGIDGYYSGNRSKFMNTSLVCVCVCV